MMAIFILSITLTEVAVTLNSMSVTILILGGELKVLFFAPSNETAEILLSVVETSGFRNALP